MRRTSNRGRTHRSHTVLVPKNRRCQTYPVVLVRPRDPRVWAKDPRLKAATNNVGSPSEELEKLQRQYIRNYLKDWHTMPSFGMLANVHLTIGGQRLY